MFYIVILQTAYVDPPTKNPSSFASLDIILSGLEAIPSMIRRSNDVPDSPPAANGCRIYMSSPAGVNKVFEKSEQIVVLSDLSCIYRQRNDVQVTAH
jgi:hypothetical protein